MCDRAYGRNVKDSSVSATPGELDDKLFFFFLTVTSSSYFCHLTPDDLRLLLVSYPFTVQSLFPGLQREEREADL